MSEEKKTHRIAIRLEEHLARDLEAEAKRRGVKLSTLIRNVCTEFLRPGTIQF